MNASPARSTMYRSAILAAAVALSTAAQAGVLVTRSLDAQKGELREEEDSLVLRVAEGDLAFAKESVLWCALDPAVDTFLKAARRAVVEKQPAAVVRRLLQASVQCEPATAAEAGQMLDRAEQAGQERLDQLAAARVCREPLNLNLPRPPVTISCGPPVGIRLSLEQANFDGFVNYNTYAVANGRLFVSTDTGYIYSFSQSQSSRQSLWMLY